MPAIKSCPMDSSVRMAYRIKPRLGGINIPMVPPAAIVPEARRSLYLYFFISGRATDPRVTIEAELEPVMAARPPAAKTVDTANPPGKRPNHL